MDAQASAGAEKKSKKEKKEKRHAKEPQGDAQKEPDNSKAPSKDKERLPVAADVEPKKTEEKAPGAEPVTGLRNPARVLCIDGGGVRGVVPLEFLVCLEEHARMKVTELFDLICGTSTGAIIAFLIGALGMKVRDCLKLYQHEASAIFDPVLLGSIRRWKSGNLYDSNKFIAFIKEQLSALKLDPEITLEKLGPSKQAGRVHVFAVATRKSAAGSASLFRNYPAPGLPDNTHLKKPLWGALRATSAAPTFFKPMEFDDESFVDGGVLYNCPLEVMSAELRRMNVLPQCILSLGCGSPPPREIKSHAKAVVEWMIELATAADRIADKFSAPPNCLFHRFTLEGIDASLDDVKSIKFITTTVRDKLGLPRNQDDLIKLAERLKVPQ